MKGKVVAMRGCLRNEDHWFGLRLAEVRGFIQPYGGACLAMLRNEATRGGEFVFARFLQPDQHIKSFVEGALVGGVIAEEQ